MYGTILLFLIALTMQALAPTGGKATLSWSDPLHLLLFLAVVWGLLRWRLRRHMVAALHGAAEAAHLRPRFTRLVQSYQGLLLLPHAYLLYATPYPTLAMAPLAERSEVLGSLAGLAPFLFFWLLLWWEAYPLQAVLFGRSESRASFVRAHARMELPILLPWLVASVASDLFRLSAPEAYARFSSEPLLQLAYAPLFLLLAALFLPVAVASLWGCKPVEAGPFREDAKALLSRLNVRVHEILYWPLLGGKLLTAGIFGLTGRFRYLLVTPALLKALDEEELSGVIAHEAGHVRHHHLWYYLLFFAGLMMSLMAVVLQGIELLLIASANFHPGWFEGETAQALLAGGVAMALIALLFVAFRIVFGAVSRAFERQADVFALEALGNAEPLVSALERIAHFSGDIRDLPSWHHGSVSERVDFLRRGAADPALLAAHHRKVRRMKRGFALALLLFGALAVGMSLPSSDLALRFAAAEKGLDVRVAVHPQDVGAWKARAMVRHERGEEAGALADYEAALALLPDDAETLNALAWLLVTAEDPGMADPPRALALAERAAGLAPVPPVLDTLAEARYRTGDVAGAVEAIDRALAQNPPEPGYYLAQRERFLGAMR